MTVMMPLLRIALALAAVLQLPATRPEPGNPGGKTGIVFLSNRAGVHRSFDLFLVDTSSGLEHNITAGRPGLGLTSVSGPRLLQKRHSVVCFASGGKSIVEIPLGPGAVRTLAAVRQASGSLAVSPDEEALLYSDRAGQRLQIHEIDITRGTIRNLSSNGWNNSGASYSPDGSRITYVSDQDGSPSIGLMARDGSHQKILTNNFGDDRFPCFSPAGDRIIFCSSRSALHDGQFDLYTIDTSGGDFRLLYSNGASNSSPVCSPDGKEVAFVSTNLTKKISQILLLDRASGSVADVAAELPLFKQNLSLSNDGRFLLFEHNTVRDCEVMLYDRKDALMRNLTRNPAWDCSPSF